MMKENKKNGKMVEANNELVDELTKAAQAGIKEAINHMSLKDIGSVDPKMMMIATYGANIGIALKNYIEALAESIDKINDRLDYIERKIDIANNKEDDINNKLVDIKNQYKDIKNHAKDTDRYINGLRKEIEYDKKKFHAEKSSHLT